MLESELFGHAKGSFTGAEKSYYGLFQSANKGTLFLDEIGDMPLHLQVKLLRVLQTRELWPVGATTPEPVDVRIACATHQDLLMLQKERRFREDLYARLNDYQIQLPPLRERKEDLFMLARAFLARHGRPDLRLSFSYMLGLLHYHWPYNVRELESCIKRSVALSQGSTVGERELPDTIQQAMTNHGQPWGPPSEAGSLDDPGTPPQQPPTRGDAPTEAQLRALLELHRGNVAAVGRELGKARMQVHRYMQRYGIRVNDYR